MGTEGVPQKGCLLGCQAGSCPGILGGKRTLAALRTDVCCAGPSCRYSISVSGCEGRISAIRFLSWYTSSNRTTQRICSPIQDHVFDASL